MRDRACRIDAPGATESTATTSSSSLGGLDQSFVLDRSVVEIDWIPRRCMESNILQYDRSCRSCRPPLLMQLWHSPQSIRIDLWALEFDPDPMEGSDPSWRPCRRGVLYFKGHLPIQWKSRRRSVANYLELDTCMCYFKSHCLFTESIESIRTLSSMCWMCIL